MTVSQGKMINKCFKRQLMCCLVPYELSSGMKRHLWEDCKTVKQCKGVYGANHTTYFLWQLSPHTCFWKCLITRAYITQNCYNTYKIFVLTFSKSEWQKISKSWEKWKIRISECLETASEIFYIDSSLERMEVTGILWHQWTFTVGFITSNPENYPINWNFW